MREIDARNIECPMPVIMTKRVIDEGLEEFYVLVNEEIAVENLGKLAKQTAFDTTLEKLDDNDYKVTFKKSANATKKEENDDSYVLVFDSDRLGEGDEGFSKKLLESFVLAMTEQDNYPEYIICYNSGVFLTSLRENIIEDFKKFEKAGVKILSCGLCLDNYGLKEQVKVGTITNMFEISGLMISHRLVRP